MKEVVCNYAIARFRPYRETGEFVNVGIVLICPQVNYFGYLFEKRKYKRITDFFPELNLEVFKAGMGGLLKELARVTGRDHEEELKQLVLREEAHASIGRFKELVRPREAMFHFGETGTVLAADPRAKLKELFDYYIKRQFARDREYQEVFMKRELAEFLRRSNLDRFYKNEQQVGDETYHVILPFVHIDGNVVRKAIKPLHLDKDGPTEIYRHGDAWISTVKRLRQINRLPKDFLFTVKTPKAGAKRVHAAQEICRELEDLEAVTIPFAETNRILEFARI
jgi:Protein of unknown function (DUF3037).